MHDLISRVLFLQLDHCKPFRLQILFLEIKYKEGGGGVNRLNTDPSMTVFARQFHIRMIYVGMFLQNVQFITAQIILALMRLNINTNGISHDQQHFTSLC